jgi:hypothetical protein
MTDLAVAASEPWSPVQTPQAVQNILSGTTLIVSYCASGMVMAVDDLGHSKDTQGKAIPREREIEKLFVLNGGIVVGSTGLMRMPGIEYKFEDWIKAFEAKYSALADKRPRSVAAALEDQMRETFHRMEALPDDKFRNMNPPAKTPGHLCRGRLFRGPQPPRHLRIWSRTQPGWEAT